MLETCASYCKPCNTGIFLALQLLESGDFKAIFLNIYTHKHIYLYACFSVLVEKVMKIDYFLNCQK